MPARVRAQLVDRHRSRSANRTGVLLGEQAASKPALQGSTPCPGATDPEGSGTCILTTEERNATGEFTDPGHIRRTGLGPSLAVNQVRNRMACSIHARRTGMEADRRQEPHGSPRGGPERVPPPGAATGPRTRRHRTPTPSPPSGASTSTVRLAGSYPERTGFDSPGAHHGLLVQRNGSRLVTPGTRVQLPHRSPCPSRWTTNP